ncbi:exodeoxyribonuclease V subunit gamma [Pigmentiphaga sp. GD03639]|uniref:exodeoxyribonuclease V subunit gamma n=1 Tax=Pigmentiphaga sp. GD03639 TaxID=2975354 RepID=UPI00244940B7|nr:exodeoxyribonuclease V subunit gamma [Pigmentiphaga sp. GD03639]MDH2235552.1 exodeoxyribonuclease V subunit gamma [Pigmentiphaga sp. GD03639]
MPASSPLAPGFMVVHGNRLEELRGLAVSWMKRYPLAPLENEIILVQSNGIAQWLKFALAADPDEAGAQGCGIAAAVEVQLPARFLWQAYRAVLGKDLLPETSSLDRNGLTWRLLRLLPQVLGDEVFLPLRRFLADDDSMRKRHQLAERLADLFDQYQVYRADWLDDWEHGRDVLRTSRRGTVPLGAEDRWQAALWRAVLADVGDDGVIQSRARVHRRFLARLAEADAPPRDLPRRVIVFGISSMPAQSLEALAALSKFCQVLLCVHNPCQHHWTDIVADQDLLRHQYRRHQRKPGMPAAPDAQAMHRFGNPLLAAWGKQGRDYIHLLDTYDIPERYQEHFASISDRRIDLFSEPPAEHLLAQVQDDILNLRSLEETREQWPPVDVETDASIRFHIAHSPQREVEILHDQLLARFDADPSLRPRDVIVMVPDIDAYAPHIRAVFGQIDPRDRRHIPYTLADQGQRGREPLLIAVEHLLRLPESRFAVSEILDLLDVPAVRQRFGLRESDLPQLHRWIAGAGVRWGVDAGQRASLGLPGGMEQNTWRFGLRRMLLGYAVGAAPAFEGIEPYDEVGGLDAALVGSLDALLESLERIRAALATPAAPQAWGFRLRTLMADLFTPTTEREEAALASLSQLLDDWLEVCERVGLEETLPLVVVREAWLGDLDRSRLNQRFLAGSVNFCTLMPMRAIPFRVVCLLGMNDGDYPRVQTPPDFDLMRADYRPGDRSRREDDRYLLLEALLSARDALYVSWVGRSVRDNAERPPSVLVAQLRDHLAAGWDSQEGADLLDGLTTVHPLQPFSPRYFASRSGRLFTYAREWAVMHEARASGTPMPQALPPPPAGAVLELAQLQAYARDPLRAFFNQRLKIHFDDAEEAAEDEEPFALDGLTHYQLSERLLLAGLSADDADEALDRLHATARMLARGGELPLAGFGERVAQALIAPLPDVLARHRDWRARWPLACEVPAAVEFRHGEISLQGWLGGLRRNDDGGHLWLEAIPGELGVAARLPRWHRLIRPWVAHLAGNATGLSLHTVLVATDGEFSLPPVAESEARAWLGDLIDAWDAGMRLPPPVAVRTAFAWLAALPDEAAAYEQARKTYEGGPTMPGEVDRNPYLMRQFPDFQALWSDEEFGSWARTLYLPLFETARPARTERKTGGERA